MRYGDEDGVFWLPAPQTAVKRTPGGKKPRQARVHVPQGPPPESDWTPPTEFPRLTGLVGFDFETHDEGLKLYGSSWCRPGQGKVVGFALAADNWEGYYPIAHEGGGNLDADNCLRYLRDIATNPEVQFVCHNAGYELGWLRRLGIRPARVPYDTQAGAALLDEYRQRNNLGYSLNAVGRDWCGILKDETLLQQAASYYGFHSKNDLWRLHSKYVGPYAEADAGNCRQVWPEMEKQLREQSLWELAWLELRYAVVAMEMRWRGIRVDGARAERFRDTLREREKTIDNELKRQVGFEVPVWEADTIAKACDKLGITYPKSPTGKPSFVKEWLNGHKHPVIKMIGDKRRWEKARGTFVEGFFINLATNGRVHPQVNPLPTDDAGTVSGRISVQQPNVNQLSARDKELAVEVRGLLLPEEGAEWASLDINQQEPRIAVHFAYLAEVPGAKVVRDMYLANPKVDFHQMVAQLASIERPRAKILNLAIIYGKGEAATCHELGFDTEWITTRRGRIEIAGPDGKRFLESYYSAVPFVPGLKEACKRAATHKGYIRTLLGRRCRFGDDKSPLHTAVNRLVQGSAADQMKKAQVDMYEQLGEVPMCQVYDEVDINKYSDKQVLDVRDCIINAIPLEVPIVVDIAVGKNWGEAL
jgi:DNA polymerase-1